jgi:hypothetical protein
MSVRPPTCVGPNTSLGGTVVSYRQNNRDITRDYLIPLALSNTRKKEQMVSLHDHATITKCYFTSIVIVFIL